MVKIQMLAAPINPADLNMVEGGYGMGANVTFPSVGGNEGLAIVTQVGRGVKALAEGDHVIPHNAAFGTSSVYHSITANVIFPRHMAPFCRDTQSGSDARAERVSGGDRCHVSSQPVHGLPTVGRLCGIASR